MSTTIEESIPISDEDVEAQLTSTFASLEGRSAAELTDETIAKHLSEASDDKVERGAFTSTRAQTVFTMIKAMKVTKSGSSRPIADGATVYQWSGGSAGTLAYTSYSGSSRFVAVNKVEIRGFPGKFLVVTFYKADGRESFASFVGNSVLSTESRNSGVVKWDDN